MIIVILFIAGLAVGFFILLSLPNPTVTTVQGVAYGDTVPLYYANQTEIPDGGSRIWYESLTVGLENGDIDRTVSVFLAKGNNIKNVQSCAPPAGNVRMKSDNATLELNRTHSVLTKPVYLTKGATLSVNLTIDSAPVSAMLQLYVLNSIDKYDCIRDGECPPTGNVRRFNVSSGGQESFNETLSLSGYHFIHFSSDEDLDLTYRYEATTQYYNYTDYSDRTVSSCNITQGRSCTLKIIGNFAECAFAYTTSPGDVDVVPLKVVAHHRRFNFISIVFLALLVASLGLVLACVMSVLVMYCFKRRSRKSGYSKLT